MNPNRSKRTNEFYRYEANRYLGDWLTRPLDAISRADVESRFNSITAEHGWSAANRAMSLLRSIYRRRCVDHDGPRNPDHLWLAGGGRVGSRPASCSACASSIPLKSSRTCASVIVASTAPSVTQDTQTAFSQQQAIDMPQQRDILHSLEQLLADTSDASKWLSRILSLDPATLRSLGSGLITATR